MEELVFNFDESEEPKKKEVITYEPVEEYDIIFSSGTLHYLSLKHREKLIQSIKEYTSINGLHALNVF